MSVMKKLKKIVEEARRDDGIASALRTEIARITSSAVLVEDRSIENACEDAYDHCATDMRLGRDLHRIEPRLLLKMVEHASPSVRRLAAQHLPASQLRRLANDESMKVLHEVARRISPPELARLTKSRPWDDELDAIARRRLRESSDGIVWSSGKKVGDAARTKDVPLTDAWYENMARIIFNDVGAATLATSATPMYNLARQFAQHVKTTSGVTIDADKLVDALQDLVDVHEEQLPEKSELRLTVENLSRRGRLQETLILGGDELDDVEELVENVSASDFMERAEKTFSIRFVNPGRSLSRALLREGIENIDDVPSHGLLPMGDVIREVDERALDAYARRWNERQRAVNVPVQLSWMNDGSKVEFEVIT